MSASGVEDSVTPMLRIQPEAGHDGELWNTLLSSGTMRPVDAKESR